MGKKARLKKQKQKEKYLTRIRNSPIGDLVDYKIVEAVLDNPTMMEIFNMMNDFDQDLGLTEDANRYYLVLKEFALEEVKSSTTDKERSIWTDFPKSCLENARVLHIINSNHYLGYVPSLIDKKTLKNAVDIVLVSIQNDTYIPSTLIVESE